MRRRLVPAIAIVLGCGSSPTVEPVVPPRPVAGDASAGDAATATSSTPVRAIALASANMCVLATDGTVACIGDWPINVETATSSGSRNQGLQRPVTVQHLTGARSITVTTNRGCAIRDDRSVACWGNTKASRNGWSGATPGVLAAEVVPGITDAVELALTSEHSCALRTDHTVICWGPPLVLTARDAGALDPPRVMKLAPVAQISGQWKRICAVLQTGEVTCWGDNRDGWIDGTPAPVTDQGPRVIAGLADVVEVRTSPYHACARTRGGEVWCLGTDRIAAAGTPTRPTPVPGVERAVAIDVSGVFSCALTADARVLCWGEAMNCNLGNVPADHCVEHKRTGTTGSFILQQCATPTAIDITLTTATHLAIGSSTACVWDDAGKAECWGRDLSTGTPRCSPVAL